MATLSTLTTTGDSAVGSWLTDAGGNTNLWQKIEETIALATDTNDYIKAPADTNNSDYSCLLSDVNSDFGTMATCSWTMRYALSAAPPGANPDTYGLQIRIMSGATVLAAADSGGTFSTIVSTTAMSTTFSNGGPTAFAYVNTSATKSDWDAGVVTIRQTYTKIGGFDAHQVYVSAFEITGTYNVFTQPKMMALLGVG